MLLDFDIVLPWGSAAAQNTDIGSLSNNDCVQDTYYQNKRYYNTEMFSIEKRIQCIEELNLI